MTDTSVAQGEIQVEEAVLDESQMSALGGTKGDPGTQDISGWGYTYRHNWGPRNGWWILNLSSGNVGPNTRVYVAASEGPTGSCGKFIGSARYLVYNVAPDSGVVSIRIFVDWPSPIGLVVDYLIVNP